MHSARMTYRQTYASMRLMSSGRVGWSRFSGGLGDWRTALVLACLKKCYKRNCRGTRLIYVAAKPFTALLCSRGSWHLEISTPALLRAASGQDVGVFTRSSIFCEHESIAGTIVNPLPCGLLNSWRDLNELAVGH